MNSSALNALATSTRQTSPGKLSLLRKPNRTRDRAAKQRALVQAALQLFASKGYEATTTREIAAAAGCAEGLIHRYFKGKAGLLPALIEHQISEEVREMRQRPTSAMGLQEEFLQLVDWEIEYFWKKRDFLRVFITRALVDPSIAETMNQAMLTVRSRAVAERLRRHRQCAALPSEDLELLAQSVGMFGLVFGFMRPMVLGHNRGQARRMAAILGSILIRGLHYAN